MTLTKEQEKWLKLIEPTYTYNGLDLRDKTLSCFVAPSRTGKSRLISEIASLARSGDNIGEVNTITTRARRIDDDPAGYRTADEGITHEWMIENIEQQKLVNFKLFETGDIYATDPQSYASRHNMLPTIAESVPPLTRVGLQAVCIIYIVRPLDEWKQHLQGDLSDPKFYGRILEAKKSLEFARHTPNMIKIVNHSDKTKLEKTARSLLQIMKSDDHANLTLSLDDYHTQEFELHRSAMENYIDELLEGSV